jgi:hypothetical protein
MTRDEDEMERKVAEEYDLPRKEDGTYLDYGGIEGWLFRDLVTARLALAEDKARIGELLMSRCTNLIESEEVKEELIKTIASLRASLATLTSERDALKGEVEKGEKRLENTRNFYEPRMNLLQKYQMELPEPHRTAICDILANGSIRASLHPKPEEGK